MKTLIYTALLFVFVISFTQQADAAQFARPSGIASGGWASGTHTDIDEITRDDSDKIVSARLLRGQSDTVTFSLSPTTDPQTNQNHIVRYAYKEDVLGTNSPTLQIRLMEGTTQRASWTENANPLPGVFTVNSRILTGAQANSITNYANLRLEFLANCPASPRCPGAGTSESVSVSWAEFEVPDAPVSPDAPSGLTATAVSTSQIDLSWNAPSNSGPPITGYKIERSVTGAPFVVLVPNTGSVDTLYSDIELGPATTYSYRVSAINSIGTSPPSNIASAVTNSLTITSGEIPPPKILGVGMYKITLNASSVLNPYSKLLLDVNSKKFEDFFPYSIYSDVTDKENYGKTREYAKRGTYYELENSEETVTPLLAKLGKPVQIQVQLDDQRAGTKIEHVSLFMDFAGDTKIENSSIELIYQKGKELIIHDKNNILGSAKVSSSLEDGRLWVIFDMVFEKPLKTDVILQSWHETRMPSYAKILNALDIDGQTATEVEEKPTLTSDVEISHDASSPICKVTDSCYTPNIVKVLRGGVVTWINTDVQIHTVTSGTPETGHDNRFDQQVMPQKKFQHRFDKEGLFKYYCKLHPWATGQVIVYDENMEAPKIFEKPQIPLIVSSVSSGGSLLIENNGILTLKEKNPKIVISGNVEDTDKSQIIEIIIVRPDKNTAKIQIRTNERGYYHTPATLSPKWLDGEYHIISKYRGTEIGHVVFSVKS